MKEESLEEDKAGLKEDLHVLACSPQPPSYNLSYNARPVFN